MTAQPGHRGILIAIALTVLPIGVSVQAQTPVCGQLQAQYLSALQAQRGATGGGADDLSRQLSQARNAASQANCNHFLFFGPRPSPQCPAILGDIRRLENDLRQYGMRSYGVMGAGQQVAQVRAALIANGCPIPQQQAGLGGGTYRTLCVRLCDGYYFPIASAARRSQFPVDDQACQSMYASPGQAELFIQRQGQDVTDATSLDGKRYGDQPYALAYRQSYAPSCAVELQGGLKALAQRYEDARPGPQVSDGGASPAPEPLPVPRPNLSEDPETVIDATGGLSNAQAKALVAASSPATDIRVVGDPYYERMLAATNQEPKRDQQVGATDSGPSEGATTSLQ